MLPNRYDPGRLLAVLLIVSPPAAHAQLPPLRTSSFRETPALLAEAPVSGEDFWGIHSGPPSSPADLRRLRIAVPPGGHPYLCVRVETQDGRYWGEASYALPTTAGGALQPVEFPSRYLDDLRRYPVRDLGVRAYVAPGCGEGGREARLYTVALWPDSPPSARSAYLLLVNARDPRVRVSVYDRNARRDSSCARDEDSEARIVFDTECTLVAAPGETTLTLVRRRFNEQTTADLRVYFP